MSRRFPLVLAIALTCTTGLTARPGFSQVTADGTLSTRVTSADGFNFAIDDGDRLGDNLFHSFRDFSVPTGGSAVFNNAADIANIFGRVTGGDLSTIDGLIQANGNANLFLLNPTGILFGPNARLSIGGSFLASTAESLLFDNGFAFSATNPQSPPLLTVNTPVGLQLGANPKAITVQGAGHNARLTATSRVLGINGGASGLQVQPGRTLSLVGGNLAIEGGLLSAPGGRIELGSVTAGRVDLTSSAQDLTLTYSNADAFGTLQMTQQALASVAGTSAGAIQLQANQISIRDGSLAVVQNQGTSAAGDIIVNATESLQIVGKSPTFVSSSSLVNETLSSGAAGDIVITTPQLTVDQGGYVLARTFSTAPGGNIRVNASDIQVTGFAAGDTNAFRAVSQILASSHGAGQGGNVSLSTENLSILAGANVAARPYSIGDGGDVSVSADTILINGAGVPAGNYFSLLSAATFSAGSAGSLTVDTRTLVVEAGGRFSAASLFNGGAGNLTANASESIEVRGGKDADTPSYIGTAVQALFGFSSNANSGDTTLNTPVLTVTDGATIFVENRGNGNAGTLRVQADRLWLNNGGSLSASTNAGEGGNIDLQLRDLLLMRHGSFISAEAGGTGNGGNITISAPVIVGFENSDIVANAFEGNGGNIDITTQAIFGLEFRDQLTPENDITASSRFGVNGTVTINNPNVDADSALVELPENMVDVSSQIATGCAEQANSRFVATGRGGVPINPGEQVVSDRPWNDIRDLSAFVPEAPEATTSEAFANPSPLVQTNGWLRNAVGQVELVAVNPTNPTANFSSYATCSGAISR
ncbi:MAG: two-partner secretion domain-containing protein [Almyronema sp.]